MQDFLSVNRLAPDEADAKLADLAARAPSEESARDAEFERARLALRTGDVELAKSRFQDLWDSRHNDAVASRSLYELGRIAAEHEGNLDDARRLLRMAITETPPWAGAEFALQFYRRLELQQQRLRPLIVALGEMAEATDNDRMAAQIHLERGLLLDRKMDRPNQALQAYRAAFYRCKKCGATDEAVYQMGLIYTRHERLESAQASFDVVARRTGRSFFVGTYNSQRAADARYQMGMVELLYRQDYDAAERHFRKFIRTFPNHRKTDDAAWNLVQLERLRGEQRAYRRALERFIDDYSHSRHADEARRQLANLT